MHFLLCYDYAPDYAQRRGQFRDEHLLLAWESQARGEMQLGGAVDDPLDMAVMVFRCDSSAPVEAFVAAAPYVRNAIVTRWRIRRWHTVVGIEASEPTRPG